MRTAEEFLRYLVREDVARWYSSAIELTCAGLEPDGEELYREARAILALALRHRRATKRYARLVLRAAKADE
mgnify:CR=1 FL=1